MVVGFGVLCMVFVIGALGWLIWHRSLASPNFGPTWSVVPVSTRRHGCAWAQAVVVPRLQASAKSALAASRSPFIW
jgi:hypothetical protein